MGWIFFLIFAQLTSNYVVIAQYEAKMCAVRFYAYSEAQEPMFTKYVNYGSIPVPDTPILTGWTNSGEWVSKDFDTVPFGEPIYRDSNYVTSWSANISGSVTVPADSGGAAAPLVTYLTAANGIDLPKGACLNIDNIRGTVTHTSSGLAHVLQVALYPSTSINPSKSATIEDEVLGEIEFEDKTSSGKPETFPFDIGGCSEYYIPDGIKSIVFKTVKTTRLPDYHCTVSWIIEFTIDMSLS